MKSSILMSLVLFLGTNIFAGKIDYNLDKGYMAEGYDVVAYFSNKAVEGKKNLAITHDGVKYKFSNKANYQKFKKSPQKYIPEYGGWCAYAMGVDGSKVGIDPETFEIRDGKLYLFYNAWLVNTKKSWLKKNPKKLQKQADAYWLKVRYK